MKTDIQNSLGNYPVALCVEDLMQILRIGRNTAYKLVQDGCIRSVRVGHQLRIPRDALEDFLSGGGETH